jgi:hypothetical protein
MTYLASHTRNTHITLGVETESAHFTFTREFKESGQKDGGVRGQLLHFLWFFILLSLFWKMKKGLWNHFAVCLSVYVSPQFFVFYAVRVLPKESMRLVSHSAVRLQIESIGKSLRSSLRSWPNVGPTRNRARTVRPVSHVGADQSTSPAYAVFYRRSCLGWNLAVLTPSYSLCECSMYWSNTNAKC